MRMVISMSMFMFSVIASVFVMFMAVPDFMSMLMNMKEADQKEGHEHTGDDGTRDQVVVVDLNQGVWDQMQQRDAQHQATNETHQQLHPPMCQIHDQRQPPAQQRCRDDQDTVSDKKCV